MATKRAGGSTDMSMQEMLVLNHMTRYGHRKHSNSVMRAPTDVMVAIEKKKESLRAEEQK